LARLRHIEFAVVNPIPSSTERGERHTMWARSHALVASVIRVGRFRRSVGGKLLQRKDNKFAANVL